MFIRDERIGKRVPHPLELETLLGDWLTLLERSAAGLQRLSTAFLEGRQGADAVQETLVWAYRHVDELSSKPKAEVYRLLARVLRDKGTDLVRREGRQERHRLRLGEQLDAAAPQGLACDLALLGEEQQGLMAEALDNLPRRLRNVVMWRYWEGRTWAEIGDRLGYTERYARRMNERALQLLRRTLRERL